METERYTFSPRNKAQGISIVSIMGICLSTQIEAGLNSKHVSADAKDLSSPSSKITKDLSNPISNKITEDLSTPISNKITEDLSTPISNKITEDLSTPISNKITEDLSTPISKVSEILVPLTPQIEGEILQSSNLKNFSLTELTAATRNFRKDSVLGGEGDFGSVFKGWIDNHSLAAAKPGTGVVVAVKRLSLDSFQGHKDRLAEVNYLGQLSHPHLVKLIGYCFEDKDRLLVYEFMPRGSLENHLFMRGSYFQPLSWGLRLKVALGAAKGLAFLHSAETKVIYRDFKTSNVLLDSSDVFSFGVVLLEMLSGRRAVDKNRPSGQHNLVEWAKPYLANKRKLLRVLDNRLEGQYELDEACKVATLSLRCLAIESKLRPTMDEVATDLEQLQVPHVKQNRRKSADDFTHGRIATASASPLSRDIANTHP
ncbi:hypothetical protein JHK82_032959 [Glycine max]|nr:hypothetical protein JHK82_032959 [Glycine max]